MKKHLSLILALLIFTAGAASAAIVITLNGYRNVTVALEPIGNEIDPSVFMVSVTGRVIDSAGGDHQQQTLQFRSDDPKYLAAPFSLNPTAVKNFYVKSRRAWKASVLDENAD